MKVFQSVQKHYATLGISSSQQSSQKYPFNKKELFGFLSFGYLIASHIVYIFHVTSDFMEYMKCICSTSTSVIMFICFAAIVLRETTLFEIIDNLEKIIDIRSENPKTKRFFLKTNRQVERLSEVVFMVMVKIFFQFILLPIFIVSFGVSFITDSGSNLFQLPLPMWFPFDTDNQIGYLIAVILEYFLLVYECFVVACTLTLGIGAFWFAISATKEIQCNLRSANDKAHANEHQTNELKTLFAEFIHAHGILKQMEHDFSDIFQPMIMSLFTWSLSALSIALLIIQLAIVHHGNIVPLLLTILCGIVGLATVFIACELGQRMADAFDKINFTVDQFKWYLFPIEIQRTLSTIIANTQQPVSLECFGSIICGRDVFKNIIHSAFSYFMVLRELGD